jgi:cytidyltransferase-like protein
MASMVSAPSLESIPLEELRGKKIGYYVGSFDPLHLGHQAVIDRAKQSLDYVILYPVPGGDIYKNRSDFSVRQQMMEGVYKTDARVILTHLFPGEVQDRLSPLFGKVEIVGIVGSDLVKEQLTSPDKEKISAIFMRGVTIPAKHAKTTIGALMALPATSFIVNLRNEDDLSHLNGMFGDRPIRELVKFGPPFSQLSSTQVRNAVKQQLPISEMVTPNVAAVIQALGLYKS